MINNYIIHVIGLEGCGHHGIENIFHLMESDSFPRFRRSSIGLKLQKRNNKKSGWRKSIELSNGRNIKK